MQSVLSLEQLLDEAVDLGVDDGVERSGLLLDEAFFLFQQMLQVIGLRSAQMQGVDSLTRRDHLSRSQRAEERTLAIGQT